MNSSENQRNKPMKHSKNVDAEVQNLFKKRKGTIDLTNLRKKYSDIDLADKIQTAFIEKHRQITKKAKKFAQLIRERYSNEDQPFHILLNKALQFKEKLSLSDAEFAEFQRIYEQELVGIKSQEVYVPATYMQKVLGGLTADGSSQGFNVSDNEHRSLQEILKLASSSRPLHAQVVLQSIQYQDLSSETLQGTYKPEHGHRLGEHVHPVVVALFAPKMDLVEQHFLMANLANLVKTRYNKQKIQSLPDYELFYNLITDPNDIVCSNRSPVMDLLNRCNLQNQLWNSVLNLRNGQYYNNSLNEFVSAVDLCKQNKNDNPDLIYGRHDGTVLKRLISAFSFRPTVVATLPQLNHSFNTNPYSMNIKPTVTSVPMINLKLPLIMDDDTPIELKEAKNNSQLFVNNDGKLEYRNTSIIYSRDVLMFYVDRRANVVKLNNYQPFSLNKLPTPIAGFEKVNKRRVIPDPIIRIRQDVYTLRSVVCAKTNDTLGAGNLVIGSFTVLRRKDAGKKKGGVSYMYDPYSPKEHDSSRYPFVQITKDDDFDKRVEKQGTVFIYQLIVDKSKGEYSL
tara:strand:+ start:1057 stop:2751 length:1695 start_codon:yes stop_codon:yes gene_type:complete